MNRSALLVRTFVLLATNLFGYSLPAAQVDPSIHFILPDGYVGAFRLELSKRDGVEMKLEHGRYVLEIPRSGTLRVRSFKAFADMHSKTAAYKSGKEIPHDPSGSLMPRSVALRRVWTVIGGIDEHGEMIPPVAWTYIIGTKRQADELKRRLQRPSVGQKKPANDPCKDPQTQSEMNVCSRLDYEKADAEMKKVFQQLMLELGGYEKNPRTKFEEAEAIWLKYREGNCDSEAALYEGGSIRPTIYYSCLAAVTRERTKRLKALLVEIRG
jgi:uncharacterized protein YecT (DUF1311 family)